MTASPESPRAALDELVLLLTLDTAIDEDDPLRLRLTEISIAIDALEATSQRKPANNLTKGTLVLAQLRIEQQLAQLATELLGYFALPTLMAGDNEPPLGGELRQLVRSRYLAQWRFDELQTMRITDELATFLLRHTEHEPLGQTT